MTIDSKVCLVRIMLLAGHVLKLVPDRDIDEISNQGFERISSEQMLLLATIAEKAASLLKEEAATLDTAAA